MPSRFAWTADMNGMFCSSFAAVGRSRRYMVVEASPGGGWDWIAWANDGSGRCLHGLSDCAANAISAAEHCAELMDGPGGPNVIRFSGPRTRLLVPEPSLQAG